MDDAGLAAQDARLLRLLQQQGEDPVHEEAHGVVGHAGREAAEERGVPPVRAERRVDLGEERTADGAERLGGHRGERVACGRGKKVAALQQVGLQEGDLPLTGSGHRVEGGGEVEDAAPVEEYAFGRREKFGGARGRGGGLGLARVRAGRMRPAAATLLLLLMLGLSACAGGGGPDGGVATLDSLRDFQAACAAKGATMQLKPDGDPESIQAYECVRK